MLSRRTRRNDTQRAVAYFNDPKGTYKTRRREKNKQARKARRRNRK